MGKYAGFWVSHRSLFMEGGGENFLSQIFKIESPPLKEQKFNGDPPCILEYFSLTPPPTIFIFTRQMETPRRYSVNY
jgi:hypothetical protein